MRQALSKAAIESEIASRFHSAFKPRVKASNEVICTGIQEVDGLTGGLPRGAITEIFGPASSGRTSLMLATLAQATTHEEVCALIDTSNSFDPKSATKAQMDLERLLWVRCNGQLEHAFKAADLLLQGGGFSLVVLDLGDIPGNQARRIISSWWYRFRRVVENKPTALLVIAADSCVRSCAAMTLEIGRESAAWVSVSQPAISSYSSIGLQKGSFIKYLNTHEQATKASSGNDSSKNRSPIAGTNVPTHSIVLSGTGWLLERLKPVHIGERVLRFESQAL